MTEFDLTLRSKPAPPPEVVAAVAAAVSSLSQVVVVAPAPAASGAWRFSGRWFGPGHAQRPARRR